VLIVILLFIIGLALPFLIVFGIPLLLAMGAVSGLVHGLVVDWQNWKAWRARRRKRVRVERAPLTWNDVFARPDPQYVELDALLDLDKPY